MLVALLAFGCTTEPTENEAEANGSTEEPAEYTAEPTEPEVDIAEPTAADSITVTNLKDIRPVNFLR